MKRNPAFFRGRVGGRATMTSMPSRTPTAPAPETEKERRDWLKNEHKLGTNTASSSAEIDDEARHWLKVAYDLDA